ncbi:MAG: cell division cycle- protein [Pycnora praestabilis]|nr:MAG: cell division cycle- protein [Pycnora praestabilis]
MQAPSLPFGHWRIRSDIPDAHFHYSGTNPFGQNNFNFGDLSMKRSSSDYFSMKPVRGSSPTASLAADLSQNFHIDKSPQLPTPRRSLFTSNFLGAIDRRENVTTPPLPSSSPGPGNDSMDISPLPHKIPFTIITHADMESPEVSPTDTSLLPSPMPLLTQSIEPSKTNPLIERKKNALLRPSLSRTKGFSTNTVSFKANSMESQLPPFKFGTSSSKLSNSTPMSLDECFADSPPQDRKISLCNQPVGLMGPPRMKQPFSGMTGSTRNNGSPVNGHVRKPSAPLARPRKQFRRSLSMFENPADVIKEKRGCCPTESLQTIMDVDDVQKLKLPHFVPEDQPDSLPRITKETLINIMDGRYEQLYAQCIIVDCRFEYEYQGGHIEGAVNFNDKEDLTKKLFESKSSSNTLLIFHCEYSAHRAPIMAKFVRHQDRTANDFRYPNLTYPEVYILDGGYSSFFADHRPRCFPQSYVEMNTKEHQSACERGLSKLKQRQKLTRAQTFAFGQHVAPIDDSPTAPCRSSNDVMMGMDLSSDTNFGSNRMHARRMASY